MTRELFLIAACTGIPLTAQPVCTPVSGDQITGRDLAKSAAVFRTVPPGAIVAPTPMFGGTRAFSPAEVHGLASRFAVAGTLPDSICFRLASTGFDKERVIDVMQKALAIPLTHVEIVEMSATDIPEGTLEFPLAGLGSPSTSEGPAPIVWWRGSVTYGRSGRFSVWARVRITAPVRRLVAAEPLRVGAPLQPEQLRYEVEDGFPLRRETPMSIDRAVGLIPIHAIGAGAEITSASLTRPNDVNRGEPVHVQVRVGAAHLAFTGRAESAGHLGENVAVRNPESNRIFTARVDGRSSVIVEQEVQHER